MARTLDKALESAFPAIPAPCSTCGAPNPALRGVVILRPWDQFLRCPACGGSVTESGMSLTPVDARRGLAIIVLARDPVTVGLDDEMPAGPGVRTL